MSKQKLLLVFNPKAGQGMFPINLFEVVDTFTKAGYEVTVYPTQSHGDAKVFIADRARDFDVLVCSGGDGTLNEAIDALMVCEERPVFGYIPSGSTNDFAASLGLPKDLLEAAAVITNGRPTPLDIGSFGEEFFSYIAAFGLFTDVSYATPQSKKNVLGHLAYLLEGVKRLGAVHSYRCTVDLGNEVLQGDYIFGMVTNSRSVGGFRLPADLPVEMDDGLFEVALLQNPRNFMDLQNVIATLINQERYTDSLIFRRASKVVVTAEDPIAWTLDGEYGGEFRQVAIRNLHKAISILL